MIQAKMLQAALAALSMLETVQAIKTKQKDILDYPDFEAKVQAEGGFQWEAYPITTPAGYNVVLFRLIGDALG